MNNHWDTILFEKIKTSGKIIILGNVAVKFLRSKIGTLTISGKWDKNCKIIELIHPSKRNYSKIMQNKEYITNKLKDFLNQ